MPKCPSMGQTKESIRLADSAQPHVRADRQNYNGPATRFRSTFNPSIICNGHTAPPRDYPSLQQKQPRRVANSTLSDFTNSQSRASVKRHPAH